MDVDARMQLFDMKTSYKFQTTPGVDKYNMPYYAIQVEPGSQNISYYPVYQGFLGPAYINGIQVPLQTQRESFYNIWPDIVQQGQVIGVGDGSVGPYTLSFPIAPNNTVPVNPPVEYILRGHVDVTGIIAKGIDPLQDPPLVTAAEILLPFPFIEKVPVTSVDSRVIFTSTSVDGANVIVADSGQFLEDNQNYGLLMEPGRAPNGNLPLVNGPSPNYSTTQNTINYLTGVAKNVYFPDAIPKGVNINGQCYFYQTGLPRTMLFYNNVITLRSPPDRQYLVELTAYLSPAAYLATGAAIQFGYMCEYIARGAARKILSDTGDIEQFQFYEPLFREQELLVWKRSQRQWTSSRTQTIYSQGLNMGQSGFNNVGGSTI